MNPLYLFIDHASGYVEEKSGNKHLVFDSIDENKELLKKYNMKLWFFIFGMELRIKSKK